MFFRTVYLPVYLLIKIAKIVGNDSENRWLDFDGVELTISLLKIVFTLLINKFSPIVNIMIIKTDFGFNLVLVCPLREVLFCLITNFFLSLNWGSK